jgi:hypothetical protein
LFKQFAMAEKQKQNFKISATTELRTDVFQHQHPNRIAGHLGRDGTIASMKKKNSIDPQFH